MSDWSETKDSDEPAIILQVIYAILMAGGIYALFAVLLSI